MSGSYKAGVSGACTSFLNIRLKRVINDFYIQVLKSLIK